MTPSIPLQAGDTVVCPSGLKIAVREMLVSEERLLADKRLQRTGRFSTEILKSCVTDILDHGPYEATDDGGIDWRKVLQGDRFVAILAIRVATYGPKYDFAFNCSECQSQVKWRIDLTEDLELKGCPDEGLDSLRNGEPLYVDVGDARVSFRLPTGIDEEKAAKLATSAAKTPLSAALKLRISGVTIDGNDLSRSEIGKWVSKLSLGKAKKLRVAFDEADCGAETEIGDIDCPTCQAVQRVDVPFGRAFWMPE